MEIKSFKLVTGEEIIARVEPTPQTLVDEVHKPTSVFITDPYLVVPARDRQGMVHITFMPWIWSVFVGDSPSNSKQAVTHELKDSDIVLTIIPTKQVTDAFIEQTSGLALATEVPGRISKA